MFKGRLDQFNNHRDVAIKIVPRQQLHEIEILKRLDNAGVKENIHLYSSYCTEKKLFIITELCEIDLLDYIVGRAGLITVEEFNVLAGWLFHAISSCHKQNIVHLDIKLDNIGLLSCAKGLVEGNLRLLDFGAARDVSTEEFRPIEIISPHYMRPDYREVTTNEQLYGIDKYMVKTTLYAAWNKEFYGGARRRDHPEINKFIAGIK